MLTVFSVFCISVFLQFPDRLFIFPICFFNMMQSRYRQKNSDLLIKIILCLVECSRFLEVCRSQWILEKAWSIIYHQESFKSKYFLHNSSAVKYFLLLKISSNTLTNRSSLDWPPIVCSI